MAKRNAIIERFHISPTEMRKLPSDRAEYKRQGVEPKPQGFWWGVGRSWMEWCEQEDYHVGGFIYALAIEDSTILRITNVAELDAFHDEFAVRYRPTVSLWYIDWSEVAKQWDGIEIVPYLWQRRLGSPASDWYYGWDCASGVTWRPSVVVREIALVGEWKP